MAGYRPGILVEQYGFIDVCTLVKHSTGLDKATAHEHVALRIECFKRDPDLIKVAHLRRKRVSCFAIRYYNFSGKFLAGRERELASSCQLAEHFARRFSFQCEDIGGNNIRTEKLLDQFDLFCLSVEEWCGGVGAEPTV